MAWVCMSVFRNKDKKKKISNLVRNGLSKGEDIQVILGRLFGGKVAVDFEIKDISYLHGLLRYKTDERTHRSNLIGVIVLYTLVALTIVLGIISNIPIMVAMGYFDIGILYQVILFPILFFFPLIFFSFLFSISAYNLRKYLWFIYFVGLTLAADVLRFIPSLDGLTLLTVSDVVLRVVIFLLAIKLYVSMKKRFTITDVEEVNDAGEVTKRRIIKIDNE